MGRATNSFTSYVGQPDWLAMERNKEPEQEMWIAVLARAVHDPSVVLITLKPTKRLVG